MIEVQATLKRPVRGILGAGNTWEVCEVHFSLENGVSGSIYSETRLGEVSLPKSFSSLSPERLVLATGRDDKVRLVLSDSLKQSSSTKELPCPYIEVFQRDGSLYLSMRQAESEPRMQMG